MVGIHRFTALLNYAQMLRKRTRYSLQKAGQLTEKGLAESEKRETTVAPLLAPRAKVLQNHAQ
jgi:hypothetical protein